MKKICFLLFLLLLIPICSEAAVPAIMPMANTASAVGVTYTASPFLSAGSNVVWSKEYGPDDMTVDSATGAVSWAIPAGLPRESFHIGVKATNADGSTYVTWVLTVGGGNVYYVDGSAATDSGAGTAASPKKYISSGVALMSSGDTLIVRDGTYTGNSNMMTNIGFGALPPSGAVGKYTTVIAEHPGGVLIDAQNSRAPIYGNGNYISRDGNTPGSYNVSYLAFKGLIAANPLDNGNSEGCITFNHAHHIKIIDCGAYEADQYTTPIGLNRSAYMLVEGCYVWGRGRMRIVAYICDYVVMRRNVARSDFTDATMPFGMYDIYAGQHTRMQNNIAIDSDQPSAYTNYETMAGAFVDQNGGANGTAWANHLDNIYYNNIALNLYLSFTTTQNTENSDPVKFYNNIGWALSAPGGTGSGASAGFPLIWSPDNLVMNQNTFGRWRSPLYDLWKSGNTGISLGVTGWEPGSGTFSQTITNSIFYDMKDKDNSGMGIFDNIEVANYNNIYGAGAINVYNSTVTNTITTDPTTTCLKYPPRIEPGCALQSAGLSGARVGANILYMRGRSGTLFGETGFDTERMTPMWPFPHESLIKSKMQAYSAHGVNGNRGFASSTATSLDGSAQTLSKYIWEYLGNPMPSDIYGPPDTTSPEVSAFSMPTTATSLNVQITILSATDNVGVTDYLVTESASPPSAVDSNWSSSAPTSVQASGVGSKTFYPWVKDAAGNVSAVFGSPRTVTITDTTSPVISNGSPSGQLAYGTTSATLSVTTDETATCRYSVTAGVAYGSMTNTFATTGTTAHATTISGLGNGQAYNYYVRCQDSYGNATNDYPVSFSIASSIVIGETSILATDDYGNGNLLMAQQATLSQAATIQSLSFYITTAAGNIRLGIYDATGPAGGPGALKASTNSVAATAGWNTVNVTSPVSLAAGNYWLAVLPSSSTLAFKKDASGSARYYSYTYGALPATFSTSVTTASVHWSLYATLNAVTLPDGIPVVFFSVTEGNYTTQQNVTVSSSKAGSIYCTTDGSDPTTNLPEYSAPISVTTTTTIKCLVSDSAGNESAINAVSYYFPDGKLTADNGPVGIADALKALSFNNNISVPTPLERFRMDVAPLNMTTHMPAPDGVININDVILILRKAVGLSW